MAAALALSKSGWEDSGPARPSSAQTAGNRSARRGGSHMSENDAHRARAGRERRAGRRGAHGGDVERNDDRAERADGAGRRFDESRRRARRIEPEFAASLRLGEAPRTGRFAVSWPVQEPLELLEQPEPGVAPVALEPLERGREPGDDRDVDARRRRAPPARVARRRSRSSAIAAWSAKRPSSSISCSVNARAAAAGRAPASTPSARSSASSGTAIRPCGT